jgi:hypothetical protein
MSARPLAWLVLTLALFYGGGTAAQEEPGDNAEHMREEVVTRNPLLFVRRTQSYRFLASLFPQAGEHFDRERDSVMTSAQQENARTYLDVQFDMQKWLLTKEIVSVLQALEELGIRPAPLTASEPVKLIFVDNQLPVANTISPTQIKFGARMLRGLVLGSLSESTTGEEWASKRLAAFLGADPRSFGSEQDLEINALDARTRLFFAAIERGTLLVKTEATFESYVTGTLALMRRYLRSKDDGDATYAALETRLRAAGPLITESDVDKVPLAAKNPASLTTRLPSALKK